MALLVYSDALEDSIAQHMPQIRNSLVVLFSGIRAEQVTERTGKDELRASALETVRGILAQYTDAEDMEIFFTGFVMQ